MSGKRKDAFSEVIVGIFMLAVLALLVYFTIIISGVDWLSGRSKVHVRIAFADVGGLKDHDNVMYRGKKVGTVDRIELTPSNLIVFAEIDSDVVLRESCEIAVRNLSVLGGNNLVLKEGAGEAQPLAETLFQGMTPVDWMENLAEVTRDIRTVTGGGELKSIVTNVAAASRNLREVTDRIARGEGTLGRLMSSDDSVYADLQSTLTNLSVVTSGLREGRGSIGRLLTDDGTPYEDLKRTLAGAADVADRLRNGQGLAGRLLADDDPLYANLDSAIASFRKACDSFDAKATLDSANVLLDNLNATAERLKNGEGTVGKLLADDELYNEVQGLTKDVRQVLDNFRDTTPISTFGSLILGGL